MINTTLAKSFIGTPYVWGGESKEEGGFDCSGFLYNVLRGSGYDVPRDTAQGYYKRYCLNRCEDKSGALLFFGKSVTNITHVAISLGGGYMIESRGTKSNTKSKPGVGVVISKTTRRKDLVAICSVDIPTTKNVSRETLVIARPTLRRGSMGMQVDYLQKCLNTFGYGLEVDGVFGELTYNALVDYQHKRRKVLEVDGVYGKHTRDFMRDELWK